MGNEHSGQFCHNGDRIVELEKQIALMRHEMTDLKQNQNVVLEQQATLIARCTYAIWGHNGDAGLEKDVDRLKQLDIAVQLDELKVQITQQAIKIARWGGAIGLAAFLAPFIVKLIWP